MLKKKHDPKTKVNPERFCLFSPLNVYTAVPVQKVFVGQTHSMSSLTELLLREDTTVGWQCNGQMQ